MLSGIPWEAGGGAGLDQALSSWVPSGEGEAPGVGVMKIPAGTCALPCPGGSGGPTPASFPAGGHPLQTWWGLHEARLPWEEQRGHYLLGSIALRPGARRPGGGWEGSLCHLRPLHIPGKWMVAQLAAVPGASPGEGHARERL